MENNKSMEVFAKAPIRKAVLQNALPAMAASVKIGDVRFREIARFDGEEWHNVLFDSEDVVAWAPLLPVYED